MSLRITLIALVTAALLGACASTAAPLTDSRRLVANGELTPVAPRSVTGKVRITGSSTVYPLTIRMAREFRMAGSNATISVGVNGTGAGFRQFCAGAPVDIVDASRAMTDAELAKCRAVGREPVAFQIGIDALAVVVSSKNTFAQTLSFAQLKEIFTGKARRWSDVDPHYPSQPIQIYSPGTDSGTFDFFVGHVLDGDKTDLLAIPGLTLSEDDEVLRAGIEASPYAIGYFGYAYYKSAGGKLKALSLDVNRGPIAPGQATATNGSYPLARPLYLYSSVQTLHDRPEVAAFVSYYLQYVDIQIDDVGYFPATAATLAQSRSALVSAVQ